MPAPPRGVEAIAHRVDARDLDSHVAVEQILHQHHRVITFFDGLGVEVLRKLTQVGAVEVNGHRNVLLGIGEFVTDLLLQ